MKRIVLTIALCFAGLLSAGAAELKFYLESSEGYPGMPLQLVMNAVDSRAVKRPVLPEITGLSFSEAGQSQYTRSSFGGSRTVTTEYRWLVTPAAPGRFTIPAIKIELKDEVIMTDPLVITVKEPEAVEGYHLFLSSDSQTVFPGMPVRLTLKWLFSSEVSRPDFTLPFLNRDDLSVQDLPAPSSSSSDIYQFEAEGHTLYASQSAEIYDGRQYASISISWDLYPEKPGTLELEPAYLAFQRVVKDAYGRKSYAPAVIPSNPLALRVKDLPAVLTDFPGGVLIARDTLSVEASLDQQRVYPGDPLQLSLRITGLVNPGLSSFRGVDGLGGTVFRTEGGSLHSSVEGKDRIVSQKIRMLQSGMTEFPALDFPYFNMKTERVETAVSNSVALEVLELDESDLNPVKDQAFFQEEELTENGSVMLKGNHRVSRIDLPSGLFRGRWIFFFAALLLIMLSHLPRISGGNLIFRKAFGRGEFSEFKKAVRELSSRGGNEHSILVRIHYSGRRWLESFSSPPVQGTPAVREDKEPDLLSEFRRDLDVLEQGLWDPDNPVSEEMKERLLKWPARMTNTKRRRRA